MNTRHGKLVGSALLSAWAACAAWASDSPATATGATNASALQVKVVRHEVTEHWQIRRGVLVFRTNQFSFIVPDSYSIKTNAGELSINLAYEGEDRDLGFANIKVQLYPAGTYATNAPTLEWLTARCLAEHPGATVLGDFPAMLCGFTGPGVELRIAKPDQPAVVHRLGAVALSDGVAEVSLTTNQLYAERNLPTFSRFLRSFRASPLGGRVEVQPVAIE